MATQPQPPKGPPAGANALDAAGAPVQAPESAAAAESAVASDPVQTDPPPASLSTRFRRWLTRVVLLSGMAALVAAMGFFMLRDGYPDLALFMGRVVWGGLVVCIGGGVLLTAAGAVQAIVAPLPDEDV